MSGWYKQQRNIVERPWFKDADCLLLYTYLKATAYVTDGQYGGRLIRRGSCPTTRSDMMEATGLSYKKVHTCLRKLVAYKEILLRGYNKFSVVTICDFDMLGKENDLFDGILEQQRNTKRNNKGTPNGNQPPIYIKEYKEDNNILISPNNSPYKKERETRDMVLEIKNQYNRTFEGVLPPCIRLSTATRLLVGECLERFGRQSVDMVFEQIKTEKFSKGINRTGFIANFTYIMTPSNFQAILERALLRQKKSAKIEVMPQPSNGSWYDALDDDPNWRPKEQR